MVSSFHTPSGLRRAFSTRAFNNRRVPFRTACVANANGVVREFFLVPYVGACIHVPPPPPNQMVYVKSKTGISLKSVHEAYWVTGKMRVEQTTTSLGASAYALIAEKIEQYQY